MAVIVNSAEGGHLGAAVPRSRPPWLDVTLNVSLWVCGIPWGLADSVPLIFLKLGR